MSGGKWKGADKPAGCHFQTPGLTNLIDCPACKFGTLDRCGEVMKCADCGKEFPKKNQKSNEHNP